MIFSNPQMTVEKWFFLLISALVLYLFWTVVEPFALVVLTSGIVAIMLTPIDRRLRTLLKSKKASAAIVAIGSILLIMVPLFFLLLAMAQEARSLLTAQAGQDGILAQLIDALQPVLTQLPEGAREQILALDPPTILNAAAQWSLENINALFSSTTKILIDAAIFFIGIYYFLVDRDKLSRQLVVISPFRDSIDQHLIDHIVKTVRSVVFGVLILAVIQGVLAAIGLAIFGVPGSIIIGALTVLAAMIPLVGVGLTLIPAILYLLFVGQIGPAIGLTIWSAVVVGLSDNFLAPFLIRGTTHMHTFLVLLSVLGGMHAFGAIGAIAGPIVLAALLALLELYKSGIWSEKSKNKTKRKAPRRRTKRTTKRKTKTA